MTKPTDPKLDDDPLHPAVGLRAYAQRPPKAEGESATSSGATDPADQGKPGHSAMEDGGGRPRPGQDKKPGYRGA
jgi:hypothetical protein